MSIPARYPDHHGHSRPGSVGYSSSKARPVPTPKWEGWGAPNSVGKEGSIRHRTPVVDPNKNRTAINADGWGCPAPASWGGQGLGDNLSAKPTPLRDRCTNSRNGSEVDAGRNYPSLENLSRHIDHQQKRQKWRDEILNGDPEKAITASLKEASRVVVSFITRGSSGCPNGQGTEILRFRPPRKTSGHFPTVHDAQNSWTYFTIDTSLLFKNKKEDVITTSVELSKRPLAYMLPKLDVKKDLKLVCKSKPLLWDNSTILESYLYRIVGKKEDPGSDAGKDLAERLGGPSLHGWYQTSEIHALMMSTDSDLVCTALNAVFLPPPLSAAIDSILADQESLPEQLALKSLETFYLCVQLKHARLAFKFYPVPPPPSDQPENVLVDKRRIWAYWTEVLAWRLSKLREDAQASISYAMLKSLSAVKDSVDDPNVSLDELDKIMVAAIATEADRSRYATNTLIQEAACECLHNSSFFPSEKMHIITAGDSPIVLNVISKLINHVLCETIPNGSTTSKKRILELKITISESRPLSKGVILATKLAHVVDSYMERRDRVSKQERCAAAVPSGATPLLDPDIRSRLIKGITEKDPTYSPTTQLPHTLGLSHLLADLDAKKDKKEPKVQIEVITDAAVVNTITASRDSGIKPIIILSADCILPNGSSVNDMAWAGKSSGGVVLILCRVDQIHCKGLPVPPRPKNPINQIKTGWKLTIPEPILRHLQSSSLVKITNPTQDNIDQKFITGYITELGLLQGNNMLKELVNKRCDLQKVVWPINDLTK